MDEISYYKKVAKELRAEAEKLRAAERERARDVAEAYSEYRREQTVKQAERAQKHNDRLAVEKFLATFKWEGR